MLIAAAVVGLPERLHACDLHDLIGLDGHGDAVVEQGVGHVVLAQDCRQMSASRWRVTSCTTSCSCPCWSQGPWWASYSRGGAWRGPRSPGSRWPPGVHFARWFCPANRSHIRNMLTLVGVWTALTRSSFAFELFSCSRSTVSDAYMVRDPSLASEDLVSLLFGTWARKKKKHRVCF